MSESILYSECITIWIHFDYRRCTILQALVKASLPVACAKCTGVIRRIRGSINLDKF